MKDNLSETFSERLAAFKAKETPEVVLLIADDPELTKIIVAWMSTAVSGSKKGVKRRGDSEHAIWEWLWKNTTYSREEFLAKSAVPAFGFNRKVETLIGNRIIYPDGTVNSFIQRYLREKVLKLFAAKPTKATKKRT